MYVIVTHHRKLKLCQGVILKKKRVSFFVDEKNHLLLKKKCDDLNLSMAHVLNKLISRFVLSLKKKDENDTQ
jgi:hypothetical protein